MSRLAPVVVVGFVLAAFLAEARDNPVTNGSFEKVAPNGVPADWSFLGPIKVSDDAHGGKHAVLFERPAGYEREVGLNREWKSGAGQQGKMLSELKGGFRFWYKVLRADSAAGEGVASGGGSSQMQFTVIPMDPQPLEKTGAKRVIFEIPAKYAGDNPWHQGIAGYDFTGNEKVKWIHVGGRLKGDGAFLLDDVEWVASVGPIPKARSIRLYEAPGAREGERVVDVVLENAGDQPSSNGAVTLSLPPALRCASDLTAQAPVLKAGEGGKVKWTVSGRYEPGAQVGATYNLGEAADSAQLTLSPRLVVEQLRASRFILEPGETADVALVVRNKGIASGGGVTARLQLPGEIELTGGAPQGLIDAVQPGRTGGFVWKVRAVKSTPGAAVRCEARLADGALKETSTEFVILKQSRMTPPAESFVGVSVSEKGAIVAGPKVRLLLPKTEFGYGLADFQILKDGAWKRMARLSSLGRIAVRLGDDRTQVAPLYAAEARSDGKGLTLSGHWSDRDGREWAFLWRVAPNVRFDDLIDFETSAVCNRDAKLLCLDGPMLHVGEGEFGGDKDQALFPGLEWLVKGEESSSGLDIEEGHEHHIRLVPHPHFVTVPLMTVWREGMAVGLMWDHLRPYYGDRNRPSAVFASPNRFDGHDNTLMGLFVPSMPETVAPNERMAHAPLGVKAGEPVTLAARLYGDGQARDVLSAVDRWYALYGAPQPERLPHGKTLADEFSFSARAYLDSAWIPDQNKWWSTKSPNPLRNKPVLSAAYLYDTLRCGELGSDPAISARCRKRFEEARNLSNQSPAAEDMGFDFRGALQGLAPEARTVAGLMKSMGKDGEWRFSDRIENSGIFKGKDYGLLGPDGAVEVGTCAQKAYRILRFARMTDDPQARAAGLKALAFMDRFSVPRAAQVWEVPVHTPDILASSDACEAYLEGYEITGDHRYLDKAVYWARTGLPFLYTWDVPGFEFLRYASIPVFGATWYRGSWFGRAVQWNGLRYAWAVWKLSRHDSTYPWRRIAEGITVSCMAQQVTDKAENIALWPDSITAVDKKISENLLFLPRRVLIPMYAMSGMAPEPQTLRLSRGEQTICVNACAELKEGAWEGDKLQFTAIHHAPQAGFIGVMNVAEPQSVSLDGKTLRRNDHQGAAESGWFFSAAQNAVEIRVPGPGVHRFEVSGLQYAPGRFP